MLLNFLKHFNSPCSRWYIRRSIPTALDLKWWKSITFLSKSKIYLNSPFVLLKFNGKLITWGTRHPIGKAFVLRTKSTWTCTTEQWLASLKPFKVIFKVLDSFGILKILSSPCAFFQILSWEKIQGFLWEFRHFYRNVNWKWIFSIYAESLSFLRIPSKFC